MLEPDLRAGSIRRGRNRRCRRSPRDRQRHGRQRRDRDQRQLHGRDGFGRLPDVPVGRRLLLCDQRRADLPPNLDTQLFLFDSQGYGIYANDDAAAAFADPRCRRSIGSRQRRRRILPGNQPVQPRPPELAGRDLPGQLQPVAVPGRRHSSERFGGGETLSDWNGRAPGGQGTYRITLTGTASCVPPDTTPPTVDLRSPVDGAHVRQGAEVVVDFSCADEGSSGLDTCVGTTADGELLDTSELGDVSVTVTARDHAGNRDRGHAHHHGGGRDRPRGHHRHPARTAPSTRAAST